MINLGQEEVEGPLSLSEADRTGTTGLGRVVSWKKPSGILMQTEKPAWTRGCCF